MNSTTNFPLVSIIIPCYNAEMWVREAIECCFQQTYKNLEIIAINDGSTDGSLAILKSYGSDVRVETGPNRGSSAAQNRGVALARGRYIQFLDADDFLLPEKIEKQVAFLQETEADGVYGDWRYQFHHKDGCVSMGPVTASGAQSDVLEALLAGWWVPNMALLHCKTSVLRSGGWDETLTVQNDHDFLISVAMARGNICYQPGCFSVYRRYGNVTLSTTNLPLWLKNEQRLLEKAEVRLVETGRLTTRYKRAMAKSYFHVTRNYYDLDRAKYRRLLDKTLSLAPDFKPNESTFYNSTQRIFGFAVADWLASYKRRAQLRLSPPAHRAHHYE